MDALASEESKRAGLWGGAAAEWAALTDDERRRRKRELVECEQVFPKNAARNTGFCGECDTYLLRLCADLFGYKLAHLLLTAATVKPNVEADMVRHTKAARLQGQPLLQGKPLSDEALMQLEAESRRLEDEARELSAEGGAANSNLTRAQLFAADSYKRAKRAVYEYPDDNFIELFDEESRRFFY